MARAARAKYTFSAFWLWSSVVSVLYQCLAGTGQPCCKYNFLISQSIVEGKVGERSFQGSLKASLSPILPSTIEGFGLTAFSFQIIASNRTIAATTLWGDRVLLAPTPNFIGQDAVSSLYVVNTHLSKSGAFVASLASSRWPTLQSHNSTFFFICPFFWPCAQVRWV